MGETITITGNFCGPTESGQGGYVSGLLAGYIPGSAEVTLRVPPPLDTPMALERGQDGSVSLVDGVVTVARAVPAPVDLDVPAPPSYEQAAEYSAAYIGFEKHAFPRCFVCGPHREQGDGLRIFPGRIPGTSMVAATWTPYDALADESGFIRQEFMWAALDCPGAFAVMTEGLRVVVLGRLAASIERNITTGENYVVTGWTIAIDGRKLHAGTAIFNQAGEICARAKATWIDIGGRG